MTYLFDANTSVINEVEIKNDANNALRVNVQNNNTFVSTSNPFPVAVQSDSTTPISIKFPDSGTTAFEELLSIPMVPVIQTDAVYGYDPTEMDKVEFGGATVTAANSVFTLTTGTTPLSVANLRTKRFLKYRPGQGSTARYTAAFTTGAYGFGQWAGLINAENAYIFGYSDDKFGILHFYGGKSTIVRLNVGTAPNANQNATITLDGTAYTIQLVSGTANAAAARIASNNQFTSAGNAVTGWRAQQVGNTVSFVSNYPATRSGTYSFSSTGNATGSFNTLVAGNNSIEHWTWQEDWNGIQPTNFDPTKLNVYTISMRWLGAGIVRFGMEDPASGKFITVHTQKWTSKNNFPHVDTPSFQLSYSASNYDASGSSVSIRASSMMGGIEGLVEQASRAHSASSVNTGNRSADTIHHVLTISNPIIATTNGNSNVINTREIIIKDISFSFQGNDPVVVYVFVDPTPATGTHDFIAMPNTPTLQCNVAMTFSVTTDNPVATFVLPTNGTQQFDMSPYRLTVPPGSKMSIAFSSTSVVSRTAIATVWVED